MGFTNKGARYALGVWLRGETIDTNTYLALCTSATAPTVDTNTLGQLTEIASGNGYTSGGYQLTHNSTDFDTITENDTDDRADVQLKDIVWTASGGSIPASGDGARYLVWTDDNGTVSSREVYAWWDLSSDRSVSDGQPFTMEDFIYRIPAGSSGSGWTNKGAYELLNVVMRGGTVDTNMYLAMVTSATAPGPDTNTLSDLTEIASGNGYTSGGYQLTPNTTDFDVATEDDTNDRGEVEIKDVVFTASGGSIPASGDGARYLVLTDDNVTVADREVYMAWDLSSDRSVSDGETFTFQDLTVRMPTA